ncbi:MAG TPA: sugar ABC transporter substrate-binding protein [Candidatus Limnocylindrales bacterium]|nr:sugar ABC transporter substrate-binding protein [Candidatus Limnocylindrales bacterium]
MRFTSRASALAGSLLLVFGLAACGTNDGTGSGGVGGATGAPGSPGPDTGSGAPASGAGGDVSGELTVWAMGNEGALLGAVADAFMAEYPNVTVNVTPVDWGQAVTKLQTAIASGETPDVSQMGTDMMGQFAETGGLEAVPASIDSSQYFESAWNTNVVDGTTYGVPWYVETRLLYYRTDIAEQAGVTAAPTNWAELKDTATKLQQQGGAEWGIALGTKNSQEYLPFVWSNGGDVMADDGTFTLDSPEAVEALTFYDSFFEEGLAPKSVPEGFDITPAFVSGSHPMFFSGPWHIGLIEDAGGADIEGKWAIAPMPGKDSAPGTSFVGGSNFVVFKDAPNKAAAWAWIDFVSRPETQVMWYEEATVLPAAQAAWDDPALAGDENVALFGEQLGSTAAPPAIPTWAEIATSVNEQLERVTAGDASPEDGAAAMQESATSIGTGQ